jgi:hypothetical protein
MGSSQSDIRRLSGKFIMRCLKYLSSIASFYGVIRTLKWSKIKKSRLLCVNRKNGAMHA